MRAFLDCRDQEAQTSSGWTLGAGFIVYGPNPSVRRRIAACNAKENDPLGVSA
jgi:hypothetical protein